MQRREKPPLEGRLHVDEHVAATDDVHVAEGRIVRRIVHGEHAATAQVPADHVPARDLLEISFQTLRRQVHRDAFRIGPFARNSHRSGAKIGGEDLDASDGVGAPKVLVHGDGKRIDLFARGAAWHPDAKRGLMGAATDHFGEHDLHNAGVRGILAKESRHVDQDVLMEEHSLLAVVLEEVKIVAYGRRFARDHAPIDPPFKRAALVLAEIDSGLTKDLLQDARDALPVVKGGCALRQRLAQPHKLGGHPSKLCGDLRGGQDVVRHTGRDRALGHVGVLRRRDRLHEDESTGGFHLPRAQRAIGERAREDDAHRPRPRVGGERSEEPVDDMLVARTRLTRQEAKKTARQFDMMIGRQDIDVIRLDAHAVFDDVDGLRRESLHDGHHLALVFGVKVRDENERQARLCRERLQ